MADFYIFRGVKQKFVPARRVSYNRSSILLDPKSVCSV